MSFYYLNNDELYHHGILGMKWGIRRFQNPDGTLTEEGKLRYRNSIGSSVRTLAKESTQILQNNRRKTKQEYKLLKAKLKSNQQRIEKINQKIEEYKKAIERGQKLTSDIAKSIPDDYTLRMVVNINYDRYATKVARIIAEENGLDPSDAKMLTPSSVGVAAYKKDKIPYYT